MSQNRIIAVAAGLLLICGLFFFIFVILPGLTRLSSPSGFPTSDLLATLNALTPGSALPTLPVTPAIQSTQSGTGDPPDQPVGKIVFTCQPSRIQAWDQICILNADGTGFRQLTTDDNRSHRYASLAPDGNSVVYVSFREANIYEIYELNLADGSVQQLTDRLGILAAPEISPDGSMIVFTLGLAASDKHEIWMMDRDGGNPRKVFKAQNAAAGAWDPTWSPDGAQILFASDMGGSNQLWRINKNGEELQKVSSLPALRGRSDWSTQNLIVSYSGQPWGRELFVMRPDGSDQHQISPPGGNSQGPSFSPDGGWLAFTAYFDNLRDDHGCEIYLLRVDDSNVRRLTDNDYCDYQPRWGP